MTLFLVFLAGYTLSQFYRSFVAVIAPELAADLGLGPADLANVSAAWFLVFALAQLPVGVALDRIGPRRTVPALMVLAALGALGFSASQGAMSAVLANGLIGLGCSAVYMGALYMFARTQAPTRFGFLTSWLLGLGSSGNLIAATPLSAASAAFGWRAAFVGIAVATLCSAALIWLAVRDPERVANPAGKVSMAAELGQIVSLKALWPLVPLLLLSYAAVLAERSLWIGPYLDQVHGLGGIDRGNAILAMASAMCLGALAYGVIDRTMPDRRRGVVATGTLATAACFLMLGLNPHLGLWAAVGLLACAGFLGLSNPIAVAEARLLFPPHLIGRGLTTVNFLTIGGAGLVQWASGLYVAGQAMRGVAPADIYATLHLAFAAILVAVTAVYCARPTTLKAAA